jgi:hypothetical protein
VAKAKQFLNATVKRAKPIKGAVADLSLTAGLDAIGLIESKFPSFQDMWDKYSDIDPCTNPNFNHQCAIRMSKMLQDCEHPLDVEKCTHCKNPHIGMAKNFAKEIRKQLGDPVKGSATSKYVSKLKVLTADEFKKDYMEKTGIIYFEWQYSESGTGHVDLWNKGETKTGNYLDVENVKIWFWEVE